MLPCWYADTNMAINAFKEICFAQYSIYSPNNKMCRSSKWTTPLPDTVSGTGTRVDLMFGLVEDDTVPCKRWKGRKLMSSCHEGKINYTFFLIFCQVRLTVFEETFILTLLFPANTLLKGGWGSQLYCLNLQTLSNYVKFSMCWEMSLWLNIAADVSLFLFSVSFFLSVCLPLSLCPILPILTLESSVSSFWWCSVATTQCGASEIFMPTHIHIHTHLKTHTGTNTSKPVIFLYISIAD